MFVDHPPRNFWIRYWYFMKNLVSRQDVGCHDTRSGSISVAPSDIYGRPDLGAIWSRSGEPFCMQYMGWSNYDQESPRLLIGDIDGKYILMFLQTHVHFWSH